MEKQEVLDLIEFLGEDEHAWVDYKEDYDIGGIARDKAEFVKDVASLANTITDEDYHYIIVGVNDDGDLVGISDGREEYRGKGPRHIFSYDESSIQQTIDSNLENGPEINWYIYSDEGEKFGVLVIKPLDRPPCMTAQHIDEDETRHLHRGLIYVRIGSGKKIAGREEFQDIIEYRIEKQREQILEGVHKAVEIGPEWIERLSEALPDERGIPVTGADKPANADLEITQRLTREAASTLDEQLNEDIAQWKYRGDDFIEPKPLWQYYSNPNTLTLDNTAIAFLTQSSIKNNVLGGFWLMEEEPSERRDILVVENLRYHRTERAASLLLLLDDQDGFEHLMENSNTNAKYGHLSECEEKFGNTISDRVNFVLNQGEYNLGYDGWRESFDPRDLNPEDVRRLLPKLAQNLVDIESAERPRIRNTLVSFRDALWDLETVYVGSIAGGYKE